MYGQYLGDIWTISGQISYNILTMCREYFDRYLKNICTVSGQYLDITWTIFRYNLYNIHTIFVQYIVNVLEDNWTTWTIVGQGFGNIHAIFVRYNNCITILVTIMSELAKKLRT